MRDENTQYSRQNAGGRNWVSSSACSFVGQGPRAMRISRRDARQRGMALVWTAIFLFLIILLMGLALDTAKVCLVIHQLQNAADAGALAGACVVKMDQALAREQAITTTYANFADRESVYLADNSTNDPNGDVVLGRWIPQTRTFVPTDVGPNAVKVVTRRTGAHLAAAGEGGPVPLNFGGALANVFDVNCVRYTIARSSGSLGAGIITLAANPQEYADWHNGNTGLWIHGQGLIDTGGGDIQDNSESDTGTWQGFRMNGTISIDAGDFNVVGGTNPPADDPDAWEKFYADPSEPPAVNSPADRIEDPLLALNPPVIPGGVATHYGTYQYYDPATGLLTEASEYQFVDTINEDTIALLGETSLTNPNLRVLQLDPGYYPGGITLNSNTGRVLVGYEPNPDPNLPDLPVYETYDVELRLTHGSTVETSLYALGGGTSGGSGLVIKGSASLYADYVTLYITGAHNGYDDVQYGVCDLGGNGYVEISPPGDYFLGADGNPQINGLPGISLWQDIDNHNQAVVIGTSNFNLSGTLYFPDCPMEVGGTGFQAGNQIIAGALNLHGGGVLGVAYDGRNFVENAEAYIVE